MWPVMRTLAARCVVFGFALAGLGVSAVSAQAGDLAAPYYGPAPYPAPNYGPVYGNGGPCRIVLDRRVDPYGRAIVHRVRVCDEGPVYAPAEGPVVAPEYGYPPSPYYAPQPSGYDPYAPRPPAPIGPGYYN